MDLILKGFIIGVGKIIPGVSGSALAITLGIYEQLLNSISNIKNEIKTKNTFLIKVGIGLILAITLTSKIIVKCLKHYYLPTILLFTGLIIGGIPPLLKQTKLNKKDIIIIILITLILTILSLNINTKTQHILKNTPQEIINLIGIGILDSASSIIPGISGTSLLMMIGYYEIILNTFSTLLNINYIKTNAFVIIPFIIGFIIGTILISKIITHLFNHHRKKTYILIISFSILSIIILLKNINNTPLEILKNTPLLLLGYIISRKLEK